MCISDCDIIWSSQILCYLTISASAQAAWTKPRNYRLLSFLPPGKPSQISRRSYRQKTPAVGCVSGSSSKLSNSRIISDIFGAKIINVQSRLLGYFSGKPGDLMNPLLEVKFLEHSGPERGVIGGMGRGKKKETRVTLVLFSSHKTKKNPGVGKQWWKYLVVHIV